MAATVATAALAPPRTPAMTLNDELTVDTVDDSGDETTKSPVPDVLHIFPEAVAVVDSDAERSAIQSGVDWR